MCESAQKFEHLVTSLFWNGLLLPCQKLNNLLVIRHFIVSSDTLPERNVSQATVCYELLCFVRLVSLAVKTRKLTINYCVLQSLAAIEEAGSSIELTLSLPAINM